MKKIFKTIILIFIVTFGYQVISNSIDRINESTEARKDLFAIAVAYQVDPNEYKKEDDRLQDDIAEYVKINWTQEWEEYNQKIYTYFNMIKNLIESKITDAKENDNKK